ncbi:MAG: Ribosomal small subunit methyltransferase [Pseudonocardiales bacterium]|nr:Ribosomal small subunit methyltransferase [Pseudonocardiales bacterium]
MGESSSGLLGPAEIRALAESLGIRPTKSLGQNFLHDANTIRRIVRTADLVPGETVLEVGPGLGSLTLGLLDGGAYVVAIEIDAALSAALPATVADRTPDGEDWPYRLTVIEADALAIAAAPLLAASPYPPTALVANLPYNVAVPVVLHLWAQLPTLQHGLVLVQAEVADRLAAPPGSRTYGVPSAKAAWFAAVTKAGAVARPVFWPAPNVDSGLVRMVRRPPPDAGRATREQVFALIDAAFAQRRKMLRSALAGWAGSPARAIAVLEAAGVDPTRRGETLTIGEFAAVAAESVRDSQGG